MKPTRAFDCIYHQKQNYSKTDALNAKVDGKWVNYSTQAVIDTASQISLGLKELGIQKGDKVAIISANRPEWCFVDLGIQQLGAVSVPIYPTISMNDYKYIFKDAGVKIAFVGDFDIYEKVAQAHQSVPLQEIYSFDKLKGVKHWTEVTELGKDGDLQALEQDKNNVVPDDLLTLIYTSGTTGVPKGVMLTHHNVTSNVLGVEFILNIEKGKSPVLSFLPMCHIFERTCIYLYLYVGVSIYFAENMEKLVENIQEVKPHAFTCVPRLLEKIYDKILTKGYALTGIKRQIFFWALNLGLEYDPSVKKSAWYNWQLDKARKLVFSKWQEVLGGNVRMIVVGSAALQPRLARVFWAAGIKVCEGYGLTETSPVISANIGEPDGIRIGTVGRLIQDVQVKIAEDGEILCKGPNVMKGYYNQPEKTAEVFTDGWFHTGDIGEFVDGDFLKITDRKKEMFKTSGGKYIAPQVMENKFKESLLIEQIMVVGNGRKFAGALIVPSFEHLQDWAKMHGIKYESNEQIITHDMVIKKYQEEVDKYNEEFGQWEKIKRFQLVAQVWSVETEELTPTMKLKRRKILAKYADQVEAIYKV